MYNYAIMYIKRGNSTDNILPQARGDNYHHILSNLQGTFVDLQTSTTSLSYVLYLEKEIESEIGRYKYRQIDRLVDRKIDMKIYRQVSI